MEVLKIKGKPKTPKPYPIWKHWIGGKTCNLWGMIGSQENFGPTHNMFKELKEKIW